jgi:hypothetical protein
MRHVDSVIVHIGGLESEAVRTRLVQPIEGEVLQPITSEGPRDAWGGARHPQVDLYAAAFNGLNWRRLFDRLESIDWQQPRLVQVLIGAESGGQLELYELQRGRLTPVNAEAALQVAMTEIWTRDALDGTIETVETGRGGYPRSDGEVVDVVQRAARTIHRSQAELEDDIRRLLEQD